MDNKTKFFVWMRKEALKSDGTNYSPSYIDQSVRGLEDPQKNGCENIFCINDIESFERAKVKIEKLKNFKELNKALGNQGLKPALDLYARYLKRKT